ncbi:MAG: glycosyltransferase involved in cell wall biosynthesis [Gammaproteobacteria bacterium]
MAESASSNSYSAAILIPVFNHAESIGPTLAAVLEFDYPVLLVDDGSHQPCREVLIKLSEQHPDSVTLLRLAENGGKGAAIKAGLKSLMQSGYSHAVQIDSDGQHDLTDLPEFLRTSIDNPEALVVGYPVYDSTVPKLRYYGRYLTHVWVWINTLSFEIRDTMCGFRVYPVPQAVALVAQGNCGDRMEFDPEIIVRWFWQGGSIRNIPTRVLYPIDGVSHFRLWRDNGLISFMHARLFLGMLRRLPKLLWRRFYG